MLYPPAGRDGVPLRPVPGPPSPARAAMGASRSPSAWRAQFCMMAEWPRSILLGIALIATALLAAAMETGARVHADGMGMVISAYELWYILWPGKLVVTQVLVERYLHAAVWQLVAVPVLSLPAWLLAGAPGVFLAWRCRPHRHDDDELHESLFVYDQLADAAKRDGFAEEDDDMAPDQGPDPDPDDGEPTPRGR